MREQQLIEEIRCLNAQIYNDETDLQKKKDERTKKLIELDSLMSVIIFDLAKIRGLI